MTGPHDETTRRQRGIAAYARQFNTSEEGAEAYFLDTFGPDFAEEAFQATGGRAWHGGTLTSRERSLITVAILATLGGVEERLAGHVRWAAAHGASRDDVTSAMLLVANYAGFARASVAMEIVAEQMSVEADGA